MLQRADAHGCRGLLLLIAAVMVGGCRGGTKPTEILAVDAAAPLSERESGSEGEAGNERDAGSGDGEERALLGGVPRSMKSIGHTSVVFKIEMVGGAKAVLKPDARRGPHRYKGEIAARRLAVALGVPNVPLVAFSVLGDRVLGAAASAGGSDDLYTKEVIANGGLVKGALMPWIDGLGFLALEREPLASRWKPWLKKGAVIPDDQRALAEDLSSLLVFDFVTGNWDRWSGGNVGLDPRTGRLLFIDNDGAFFENVPKDALARNLRLVNGSDRFPRGLVTRLRALDEAGLAAALGEEAQGTPLLSAKALAGVVARQKELLAIVDAKQADAGDAETLFFP